MEIEVEIESAPGVARIHVDVLKHCRCTYDKELALPNMCVPDDNCEHCGGTGSEPTQLGEDVLKLIQIDAARKLKPL